MNFLRIKSHATNFLILIALFCACSVQAQSKGPIKPIKGKENNGSLKTEWPQDNSPGDMNECFDNDLGGKLSFANPDNITLPTPSPTELEFDLFGCLTPSNVDYDDLFSFYVPEGYSLASMRFVAMGPLFDTPLNFYFWYGDDAQPVFEPDVTVTGIYDDEVPTNNLLASLNTPLPSGWYTGWIEIGIPFSTTTYRLVFTLECDDNVPPTFTSEPGSLDASLECTDTEALEAVLDLKPEGFDLGGGAVKFDVVTDETTEGGCEGTYTRVRTWQITDGCGNVGAENFVQTITVSDNTPPVVEVADGEIVITDPAGYTLTNNDVIVDAYDACGTVTIEINPTQLTCAQLNTTVPVTVTVTDACGNPTQKIANITVKEDTGIKAPWTNNNIGNTANGSATQSVCSGLLTVKSKGFSTPQSDVAHFVYVELCGDGEITARVTSLAPAGGWAGVMIRENLMTGAKKMAVRSNGANALRRDVRTANNGTTQTQQSVIASNQPWLRINRTGNTLNAYASTNGQQWSFLGAAPITMGNCVQMGLFVESSNNNLEITGTFDNITVSGGVQPLMAPDEKFVKTEEVQTPQDATPTDPVFARPITTKAEKASQIKAWPNPTTGVFNLDLSSFAGQGVVVRIFDATGKEMISRVLMAGSATEKFDLSGFTPGLYLVRTETEGGQMQTLKLVFGDAVRY
ncbi:MAG: T9SS type A sorting domain-containing protein [Saprospiraceae bacterium]|nr:T9SS type A sorting domain-containing protein [Saprospiraceae bacterium]